MTYTVNGRTFDAEPEPGQCLRTFVRSLGLARRQEGLRRRRLRCVHRVAGRRPRAQLHHPAFRADGREVTTIEGLGTPDDLHPMQGQFRDAPGFQCGFCTAGMIMTAATFTDEQKRDLPRALKGNLCRCTGYRAIEDAVNGVGAIEEAKPGEAVGTSVGAPAATGRRHRHAPSSRWTPTMDGHAAPEGAALAARPRPHRLDRQVGRAGRSRRAPRLHLGGRAAQAVHHRDPHRPPRRSRRHLHPRQRRAVRRPTGGGGAGRLGRAPPRRVAAASWSQYEVLPAVFDPEEAMADGAPQLHGYDDPFVARSGAQHPARTARRNRRRRCGFRRGRRHPRGHLLLAAGAARPPRDARVDRLDGGRPAQRAHQLAVAVDRQGQAVAPVRPAARPAARVLQARRRRLRRQAGGDLRGPGRAGHPRHRPARVLGVHPRGGVHHRLAAAPDEGHGEARRQGRRHADRIRLPQRLQHRRLRQSRRRDAVRRGCGHRALPLRQQEVRRLLGVHEHRAQRRAARLRHDPAGVRRRVRDHTNWRSRSASTRWSCAAATSSARATRCWRSTTTPTTSSFTEDGLTACIDLVDAALAARRQRRATSAHDWLVGTGTASSLHETAPPTDHISDAWATLRDDGIYEIAVGTVEFGEGTSTAHVQIAATKLGTTPVADPTWCSPTPTGPVSTPARSPARACSSRATPSTTPSTALRRPHPGVRRRAHRRRRRRLRDGRRRRACAATSRLTLAELIEAGAGARHPVHRVPQGLRIAAQRDVEHATASASPCTG